MIDEAQIANLTVQLKEMVAGLERRLECCVHEAHQGFAELKAKLDAQNALLDRQERLLELWLNGLRH